MRVRTRSLLQLFRGNKQIYKRPIYPEIPLTKGDIYIITSSGDRLDLLAHRYYRDVRLWWIISSANPGVIKADSYALEAGLEIRIPQDIGFILKQFEVANNGTRID